MLEYRANKNGGTIDPCDQEIEQCIGLEKEDYDKEYEECYADTVVIRRKVVVSNKIIDRIEVKAGKIKDKLEVWRIKKGNYNPRDYPIEAAFKEALGRLDVAHKKNKILAKEVKVLLDEFGIRKCSIYKIDGQGKGQKVKEKGL